MLFAKPTIDFIVAGLGNPGAKYEHTRHNAGFDALDYAADKWGARVTKSKFDALTDVVTIRGKKVLLLKPQTFMNASGQAIGKACSFYKVPPERVIVLFDDISLPPGKLRLRKTGSAGGHNGIKSIIAAIGQDFPRVKIGVGEKPHPDYDMADWVLGKFSPEDRKVIDQTVKRAADAIECIMDLGLMRGMGKYNG